MYCLMFHPIDKCHVMLIWWFFLPLPMHVVQPLLCTWGTFRVLSDSVRRSVGPSVRRSFVIVVVVVVVVVPRHKTTNAAAILSVCCCLSATRSRSLSCALSVSHACTHPHRRQGGGVCGSNKDTNTIEQRFPSAT
jgi:hypothetical protein